MSYQGYPTSDHYEFFEFDYRKDELITLCKHIEKKLEELREWAKDYIHSASTLGYECNFCQVRKEYIKVLRGLNDYTNYQIDCALDVELSTERHGEYDAKYLINHISMMSNVISPTPDGSNLFTQELD